MTQEQKNLILENIVETLELPLSAYEKAKKRYEDLGEWFGREESALKDNNPHIFPQGSFRLGTAIKPLNENEEYDLDLACKLDTGVTKDSHSQCDLKDMIGEEVESYRKARGIESAKEEKHRCWRLDYKDSLSFHMDIVPCIPSNEEQKLHLFESMQSSGVNFNLAKPIAKKSICITDDRENNYKKIDNEWKISNPEGYAKWFEFMMSNNQQRIILEKAQVDDVPDFTYKTTLQRVIQLLKRHRDNMFKDKNVNDMKPISIIITTLAAYSYNGETDLELALKNILRNMGSFVKPNTPRIANPVNPNEDFTDRWTRSDCKHLKLEENFWNWLEEAQNDFGVISNSQDSVLLMEQVENKFDVRLSKDTLINKLGLISAATVDSKSYDIEKENTTSPWMNLK